MNQLSLYEEYNNLSNNIKKYRNRLSLTQEQLAEKAKCSTSYKALNIDIADLFKKH